MNKCPRCEKFIYKHTQLEIYDCLRELSNVNKQLLEACELALSWLDGLSDPDFECVEVERIEALEVIEVAIAAASSNTVLEEIEK